MWRYVADLRRGDDHDPEEEFRSLLPTARVVSEALQGGGYGPERDSEARLMAAISRSEERSRAAAPRRSWTAPVLAASGWAVALAGFSLSAYQLGLSHGSQEQMARLPAAPPPVVAVAPEPASPLTEPAPVKEVPKTAPPVKEEPKTETPAPETPPAVRMDELGEKDALALFPALPAETGPDNPQGELLREGKSYLAQGKWEEAADRLQKAAVTQPADEAALDALNLSGRIAEGPLKDPKRAIEIYRKEAELARQMIEKLEEKKDAPAEPVKIRLARALTSAGLLERNPRLIQIGQQTAQQTRTEDRAIKPGE
ncbi:MAG: hypothetical protein KY468_00510 [Armatimonadetes bacterium]|nr:hypothetical protein [Armatimonadota bacterium]